MHMVRRRRDKWRSTIKYKIKIKIKKKGQRKRIQKEFAVKSTEPGYVAILIQRRLVTLFLLPAPVPVPEVEATVCGELESRRDTREPNQTWSTTTSFTPGSLPCFYTWRGDEGTKQKQGSELAEKRGQKQIRIEQREMYHSPRGPRGPVLDLVGEHDSFPRCH